jgi:DME family drug/metabolite transporter
MNRNEALGLSFIVIAGVLWGTIGIVSRWLTDTGLSALTISTFRFMIAAAILLLWAGRVYGARRLFALNRQDALLMLLNGGMLAVSQTSYLTAIQKIGVTVSTLIVICAAPLIVAAYARIVRKESPDGRVTFALVASVAGTAMLVGMPSGGSETVDLAGGVLFSLLSAVSYAAVVQIGHVLTRRHEPLRINAVSFATGAAALLVIAALSGVRVPDEPDQWLLLLYLGVFPSVTAYALFLRGMRVTSATAASILVLLEPLVAALLAAAIFGERLSPLGVAGGILMCVGFLALVRR